MKDVFDYLEEEDLLRNLPEALPQMEDETAAKRIEKMALEKLQAEAKQQKKWQKRRILIAAVCCLVVPKSGNRRRHVLGVAPVGIGWR